jgi:hypothetical protein
MLSESGGNEIMRKKEQTYACIKEEELVGFANLVRANDGFSRFVGKKVDAGSS